MKCASYYAKSIEIPALSRLVSRIFPARLVNIHLDTIDRECNRAYRLASLSLRFETVTDIFSSSLSLSLPRTSRSKQEAISRENGKGGYSRFIGGQK